MVVRLAVMNAKTTLRAAVQRLWIILVIVPVAQAQFRIVDDFPPTARGAGGYGSTGRS